MRSVFLTIVLLAAAPGWAQETEAPPASPVAEGAAARAPDRYTLVEEFTADTLAAGELKMGTDLETGLTDRIMIGTDIVALAVGATTLQAKVAVWRMDEHRIALGVKAAYLSKDTLLWGSVNEHFDELDARIVRPSISWTNELSPRLKLHTFWAKGFGKIKARLSEKGRRKLWETKHPGADYEQRDRRTQAPKDEPKKPDPDDDDGGNDGQTPPGEEGEDADGDGVPDEKPDTSSTENREKIANEKSALTSQSIQVQSITGLAQERFQLTGEFTRANGNKVLVTSRIEQTQFEQLKSNFFRLTAAHQWIWQNFQMRLGIGMQYYVMSGRDLDGEQIDEAGVQPASDIGFYWRF